jgi:hypothetical protein
MQKHSKHTLLDGFVQCYPKLAHEMGLLPEIAIIRRFGALKTQNLLYLRSSRYAPQAAVQCSRLVIDSTDTSVETGRPE